MMYLWLSDIYYLLRKRYLYLLIFFFYQFSVLFLISFSSAGFVDSFISVLGLNIITNQYSPMEIISYLYFVFFALFSSNRSLFKKDILYQLDNIFMRMSLSKWYMHKTFLFIAVMFFKIVSISIGCTHFLDIERSNNFFSFRIIAIIYNGYIIYRFITISYFICCYSLSSFSKVRWLSILSILITFFPFFQKVF